MIGSLRGTVVAVNPTSLVLEVNGVGYRVVVPPSILSFSKTGDALFLLIHEHIREDMDELYGFMQAADLGLFEQLLSISGVGPKVAMTILSVGSADAVRRAIMAGDLDTLTSVPGVGKKTAQKIVLELKGQIVDVSQMPKEDQEVIQALQSLGYPASEAKEALKNLSGDLKDVSARVREALRLMAKK